MALALAKVSARNTLRSLALLLGIVTSTELAFAAKSYLALEPLTGKKVRIDGALGDWPGGFRGLDVKVKGSVASSEALVGYDDQFLYVAARVADTKIARTQGAGAAEDHLTVELFFPSVSGKGATHKIEIFPGDPGKLPAAVKVDGKISPAAEAVEDADGKSLVLEAKIPWSSFPEAARVRVGLRGKISYTDASAPGSVRGIVSTSDRSGADMPPFPLETEAGLFEALLEPKGLPLAAAREVLGDVSGKTELEKVALYGNFLSITGPGYKEGKQFYFAELDVASAAQVTRLSLVDVSGDGKSEILIQKRLGTADTYREVIQVLQVGPDGAPLSVFLHEVAIVTPEGRVVNELTVSGTGAAARIEIAQGKSEGFEPDTYREPTLGPGIGSPILPWQTISSKVFGWKGAGIALLEEKSCAPRCPRSKSGTKKPGAKTKSSAASVKAPPPPRPPTQEEMLDRVYALYKKDRGVAAKKPRFDFVTDVVEDDQNERVLVHDKDIVVFGKGFKQGLSYTFITVGVKDSSDVLQVGSRDLTGDGKAEIIVHALLKAKASPELGGDVVSRQALFVYSVLGESLTRVFAAETGRQLDKNRVLGAVTFSSGARGTTIELTPLRAIGWTEKTYPFPVDRHPAGGLEPLLLPWGEGASRRYEFDGTAFVLR